MYEIYKHAARSEAAASPFFFTRLAGLEEDRNSNCSRGAECKKFPGAPIKSTTMFKRQWR